MEKLNFIRNLSLRNVLFALLDTPVVGPYPKVGVVGNDGQIIVRGKEVKPAFCDGKLKPGQRVILSTFP